MFCYRVSCSDWRPAVRSLAVIPLRKLTWMEGEQEKQKLTRRCLSRAFESRKWQRKNTRRKERGIHNRTIISSSDNWLCYMKEISIQINMVSLELYHRELHLKELTSQSPYSVSLSYMHKLIRTALLLHFRHHSLLNIPLFIKTILSF